VKYDLQYNESFRLIKMCDAYVIHVHDLKKALHLFDEATRNEILQYVPMGDNYCTDFHGCDSDACDTCMKGRFDHRSPEKVDPNHFCQDIRSVRNYNQMKCCYYDIQYSHNSNLTIDEHFKRTHLPVGGQVVIVDPKMFEKIKQLLKTSNPMDWNKLHLTCVGYTQCIFDSTKKESYNFFVDTHIIVKLLDSTNPEIQQWLDTLCNGVASCEKKIDDSYDPESYESLYKNTMTIRQHVEMFQRDHVQCNYNSVNHGIKYTIMMSQPQFDLLKNAYLNDSNISELIVVMHCVKDTNAVNFNGNEKKHLTNPCYDPIITYPHKKSNPLNDGRCLMS
jgi:hypothetical protein